MKEDITFLGIKISTLVAGFIGALISLSFSEPKLQSAKQAFTKGAVKLLGGTACASFVAPLALSYYKFSPELESAASFIIGIIGMNLAAWLHTKTKKGWFSSAK